AAPNLQPPDEDDPEFIHSWRVELTNHAWAALEKAQPTYHAVLLYHVQNPGLASSELAEELSPRLGKKMTSTNVRVTLHRARERFAELLVDEVARSLDEPSEQELLEEVSALRLGKACASALEKRATAVSSAELL